MAIARVSSGQDGAAASLKDLYTPAKPSPWFHVCVYVVINGNLKQRELTISFFISRHSARPVMYLIYRVCSRVFMCCTRVAPLAEINAI